MNMPQMDTPGQSTAGRAVGTTIRGARVAARGGGRAGRWAYRNVLFMRDRSAGGEIGMIRLLDLHAASCAGDTLVTIGLATTVFFSAPVGEARGRVALYLLITMLPFAILAPIVGPLLDRFRHGRRYALALTMLGRAFLAWLISDYLHNFGLFPAAFGVLALSKAYGVARSAAVPRLLPAGLGLSEAGARASVYGTLAGAIVAPLGVAAVKIGPQWPLRVAAVIFVIGAVVALRLPPRADSDPPERPPRLVHLSRLRPTRVLSGRFIVGVLASSAVLRGAYGFLALFLAFSIRSHGLTTKLFGATLSGAWALTLVAGALGAGPILATMLGSRMRIRRPLLFEAVGLVIVAAIAIFACIQYTLGTVILLSLAVSIVSGLAKLAVDATIQERIAEDLRASAFAHSETLLMLAWVVGGGLGLIPFNGRVGIIVVAIGMAAAALVAWYRAVTIRGERLSGTALASGAQPPTGPPDSGAAQPTAEMPNAAATPTAAHTTPYPTGWTPEPSAGGATYRQGPYVHGTRAEPSGSWWARRRAAKAQRGTSVEQHTVPQPAPTLEEPGPAQRTSATTRLLPREDADQPGYHLYRPTGRGNEQQDDADA